MYRLRWVADARNNGANHGLSRPCLGGRNKVTDGHPSIGWAFAGFVIGTLLNMGLSRPKAMA